MSNYEKPNVVEMDSVNEGVYMASGIADNQESLQPLYSLALTEEWEGNKNYYLTVSNNTDEKVDMIVVKVKVNGTITSISGTVSGTVEGSYATITVNNYGNGFEAGAGGKFYVHVTGTGDFSLS